MRIQYLGTGAAEGIPALYCHCRVCQKARELKGREIRTRAQTLIDGRLLLDFGPDTYMHTLQYDIELADIYHCLITHTHDDHLYVDDLRARRRSRANLRTGTPVLNVYGSSGVEKQLKPDQDGFITKDKSIRFKRLSAGNRYEIDGFEVYPFNAVHGSVEPFIYVIISKGKTMLYGHDTDFFSEETWESMRDIGIHFDVLSLDCTEGNKHIEYPGHMNFERMINMCERMKKEKMINYNTKIIANHISHNGLVTYKEAVSIGNKYGFIIAYDGMEVNI